MLVSTSKSASRPMKPANSLFFRRQRVVAAVVGAVGTRHAVEPAVLQPGQLGGVDALLFEPVESVGGADLEPLAVVGQGVGELADRRGDQQDHARQHRHIGEHGGNDGDGLGDPVRSCHDRSGADSTLRKMATRNGSAMGRISFSPAITITSAAEIIRKRAPRAGADPSAPKSSSASMRRLGWAFSDGVFPGCLGCRRAVTYDVQSSISARL